MGGFHRPDNKNKQTNKLQNTEPASPVTAPGGDASEMKSAHGVDFLTKSRRVRFS